MVDVLLDEWLGYKRPDGPTADALWVALTAARKSTVHSKVEAATRCLFQVSSEW